MAEKKTKVGIINKKVASKLRKIVEERGLKQKFLAQKIGISEGYLSDILSGKVRISLDILEKFSEVLMVPTPDLLEENEVKEDLLEKYLSDPDFVMHFSAYQDFKSLPEGEQKEALRRVLESYKKAVEAAKKMEEKE